MLSQGICPVASTVHRPHAVFTDDGVRETWTGERNGREGGGHGKATGAMEGGAGIAKGAGKMNEPPSTAKRGNPDKISVAERVDVVEGGPCDAMIFFGSWLFF